MPTPPLPAQAFEAWADRHLQPTLGSSRYEFKQVWLAAWSAALEYAAGVAQHAAQARVKGVKDGNDRRYAVANEIAAALRQAPP